MDHAVNLEWSLIVWGVPDAVVHPYVATFLYGADTLAILVMLGLSFGFLNTRVTDALFLAILTSMPMRDLYEQIKFFASGFSKTQLLVLYLQSFSLRFGFTIILALGYFRLMKRRPNWGSRGKRQMLAGLVLVVLAFASYNLAQLVE